ncbi:MAG: hypothetical protein WCK32_08815 [Chlorobiaceae bacterium]
MKSRFKWNSVPACSTGNSLQSIVIPLEWNGTNCVVPSCSTITMQGGTVSGTQKKFRSRTLKTLAAIGRKGGTGWNTVPEGGSFHA